MKRFKVIQHARNVHTVELQGVSKTDEWTFLLRGDAHHDNPHSLHDLEKKHLDECVAAGGGWIDVGDLFCAMQGKYDPLRARQSVRDEDALAADYLDSLVRNAGNFYTPYSENCVLIGRGNHETAILKNCETDLTERLCERMTQASGHKVHSGGYGGWIRFVARCHQQQYSLLLKYFHGSGGAALMSFDTLKVRRAAAVTPDADVVVSGHVHKQWVMPLARERLVLGKEGARVISDVQWHVRTGTYKDEFDDGFAGFHVEQGRTPEMMGAVWMKLHFRSRRVHNGQRGHSLYELVPEFRLAH
jgi:hypothetical protein